MPRQFPASSTVIPRFAGNFWFWQLAGWAALLVGTFPFKLYFAQYEWRLVVILTLLRDLPAFFYMLWMRLIYRPRTAWMEERLRDLILLIIALTLLGAGADFFAIRLVGAVTNIPQLENGHYLLMTLAYRILLFGIWSLLYFGLKAMISRQQQAEALREAEMQMLRAQINPHFFFNALNTIQAGAGHDPKVAALVQNLAGYLRYVLKHRRNLRVPLGEEYDAAMAYLAVEQARFCEGLEVEAQIDRAARAVMVPGVLIQPLLENAIKHGRRTSGVPLKVVLRVGQDGTEAVVITVANTGQWVPETSTGEEGVNGVGLANLRRRLSLSYPGGERLSVGCEEGWVTVQLRLPTGEEPPEAHTTTHTTFFSSPDASSDC